MDSDKRNHAMQNSVVLPQTGFLRLPTVLALYPVSRSTWYAGIKAGRFPKPVKLGPQTSAWRVEDVRALLESVST
jgi:prophage regulatory protein